jgi:hypothetical protein
MNNILHQISIWSVIIPLITGLIFFKWLNWDSKTILFIVFFASFPQILISLSAWGKKHSIELYNIYTLIEVLLYALFFHKHIGTRKNKIILLTLVGLFFLRAFSYSKLNLFSRFYYEWVSYSNLLYLLLVILFLYEKYQSQNFALSPKNQNFWYCVGLLIYAPTTFLMFMLYTKVSVNQKATYSYLWSIHDIFNTLMYLLFAIGMYMNYCRSKNLQNNTHE